METYAVSFTYPRHSRHIHSPATALADFSSNHELRNDSYNALPDVSASTDNDAVQKLAMLAMSVHGCHVTYFLADQGRGWNFHITGAYQQVMIARGMILKECPIQVRVSSQCSISTY